MPKHSGGPRASADFRSMALFVCVVETRSLTAAGRALDMTTSSVSKRISELEERLSVRLLERTTRRVWPTMAGNAFYERCARILSDVSDAEAAASELGGKPCGVLRVHAPVAFGELYVAPLSALFTARYPDVRLDVVLGDGLTSLADEAYDLAIQLSAPRDSALVAKRLATDRAVVCGAPAYFERRGVPLSPDDLSTHDCLHLGHLAVDDEWTFRTREGPVSAPVIPRAVFNQSGAIRAAALAGLGIASVPRLEVQEALRAGALRTVLTDYVARDLIVAAVYLPGRQRSPKVSAFVGFLASELPGRIG